MRLDRYSAITFEGLHPQDLAPALSAWVVPAATVARARRQKTGVPASWTAASLLLSDDLIGNDGCSVRVRWSTDHSEYLLRFIHRDDDPSVLWTILFRLSSGSAGTLLEAAVARDAPRGVHLEPTASAPRVVIDLIKTHETNVQPRELVLPPLRATTAKDAEALVTDLLLRPGRRVPVVLLARDIHGSGASIDLDTIARRMHGIAVVASLDGTQATAALSSALAANGYSRDLYCFNGAIHTYGNAANVALDHRLWLRRSLEALPDDIRSEYVGETLARHLSLDRAPPSFLFAIEDFDRRERTSRQRHTPQPTPDLSGHDAIAVVTMRRLQSDLDTAETLLAEVQSQAIQAEAAWHVAEQQRETAELEASTERMQREGLQAQLVRRRGAEAHDSLEPVLRDALRAALSGTGSPSPMQSLHLLEALYPERLVVLPEALDSAASDGALSQPGGSVRPPTSTLHWLL